MSQDRLAAPLRDGGPKLRTGDLAQNFVLLAAKAPAPWDKMLRAEPLLVVAQILAFRLDDEMTRFDLAAEAGLSEATTEIRTLAQQLDDWLRRLRNQWPETFGDAISGLDQQMDLTGRAHVLARASGVRMMRELQTRGMVATTLHAPLAQARAQISGLSGAHRQLVHAIASLKPAAKHAFEARLQSGEIDPTVGLIIAELSASKDVDAWINRFAERHTDFYYEDIIGQPRKGAAPERALLHLPSGAKPKLLPKNTALTAQTPDGAKLNFTTVSDVPITPAKVVATAGLTYDTDPQVSLFSALGCITGIRGSVEPAEMQPLDRRVFVGKSDQHVDMGLDIASDMFRLSEGHRQISVRLHLQRATDLPAASHSLPPDPTHGPDPDIALELRNDPELIRALGFENPSDGIDAIVTQVHRTAIERGCSPSLDLIYECIATRILTLEPLRILLGRIVTLALVENHPWPTGSYW